jgi:hypothetical protein
MIAVPSSITTTSWEDHFLRAQWLPYASLQDKKNIPKLVRTCLESDPIQYGIYETTIDSLQVLQFDETQKDRREEAEARFGICFSKLLRTESPDHMLELFATTLISLEQNGSSSEEMNYFCEACYDFSYDNRDEQVISDFCFYCVEMKENNLPLKTFIMAYKDYVEKRRITFDVDTTLEIRRGSLQGDLEQIHEIFRQREIDLIIEKMEKSKQRKHLIVLLVEAASGILKMFW